jgi:DNA polymerase (family X)
LEERQLLKKGVENAVPLGLGTGDVSKLLREFGQRTALRGGNPYRARAYQRATESLAALTEPLNKIIAEERLETVPGVGPAIADIIQKLARKEAPPRVLDLLSIPGLRPEKVLRIYQEFGISGLERARAGCS